MPAIASLSRRPYAALRRLFLRIHIARLRVRIRMATEEVEHIEQAVEFWAPRQVQTYRDAVAEDQVQLQLLQAELRAL